MTTQVPPATVPPDEVYRGIEEEPSSQMPFIITAFGLLIALGILVFVLFRLAGGGSGDGELIEIPNVAGMTREEAEPGSKRMDSRSSSPRRPARRSRSTSRFAPTRRPAPRPRWAPRSRSSYSTGIEEFAVPPLVGQTQTAAEADHRAERLRRSATSPRSQTPTSPRVRSSDRTRAPESWLETGPRSTSGFRAGPRSTSSPTLEGETERDAVTALQRLGLLSTIQDEFSNTVAEGLVIRTDPEAGRRGEVG